MLTEIDGLGKKPGLFVIGATNRPDLLDSALLRTGRFDKMIYLGVAQTVEERIKIVKAQTRKMHLDPSIDFALVGSKIPVTYSGAELGALTQETYMMAVKDKIAQVEAEIKEYQASHPEIEDEILPETFFKLKYPDDIEAQKQASQVTVTQSHFLEALRSRTL